MRKIRRFEWVGIFVYISILFVITVAYLLGAEDKNLAPGLSEPSSNISSSTHVSSTSGTTNQSADVNRTEGVISNQTTPDVEVPFVGDLKALSITYKPERLHKGEKGNFILKFSWDGRSNTDEFTIGLYVDNVLVGSVPGWMDARSTDQHSLYWTANDTGEKKILMRLDIHNNIIERNESNNNAALNLVIY